MKIKTGNARPEITKIKVKTGNERPEIKKYQNRICNTGNN
jgi:hypothetical protein